MTRPPENLIDGQARAAEHPATFEVPDAASIDRLGPGDFFKIGLTTPDNQGERFWVRLLRIEMHEIGPVFVGAVDNDLTLFDDWPCGTEIAFQHRHVLDLLKVSHATSSQPDGRHDRPPQKSRG